MATHMSEAEFRRLEAVMAQQRGEKRDDDDGLAFVGIERLDSSDRAPARRRPRADGSDVARPGLTPRQSVARVWTWATVVALLVLAAQVGQLANVPGSILLCATLWLVVAWLTRRRSSRGMRGFWWGALLGASVESLVRRV